MSIATGFGQSPNAAAPQKPLRERLLERAMKGDEAAQFDLGKNYETGRIGLPRDIIQALHWYREAADRGEPFAEASLGLLYEFGKGVQKDYFQAYLLYERAVSHLTGGDRVTVVEMRDKIADKLTAEQISEAQRLAKAWKPVPTQ
jgi:TPR repeat protein